MYRLQEPRSNLAKMSDAEQAQYNAKLSWLHAMKVAGKLERGWQSYTADAVGCSPALVSQVFTGRHINAEIVSVAYNYCCVRAGVLPALDKGMTVDNLEQLVKDLDAQVAALEADLGKVDEQLEEEIRIRRAQHAFNKGNMRERLTKLVKERSEVAGRLESAQMEYDLEGSDNAPIYEEVETARDVRQRELDAQAGVVVDLNEAVRKADARDAKRRAEQEQGQ